MELLGKHFSKTIEEVLELKGQSQMRCYNISDIKMFDPVSCLDTWGMDIETESKLLQIDLVKDLTNDGRSREVSILKYENIPFALYQCIGRGDVENEVIFDKKVYFKFLKDYMNEFIEKKKSIEVVSLKHEYKINNYDFGVFYIENDNLKSICKTKLNELGIEK